MIQFYYFCFEQVYIQLVKKIQSSVAYTNNFEHTLLDFSSFDC